MTPAARCRQYGRQRQCKQICLRRSGPARLQHGRPGANDHRTYDAVGNLLSLTDPLDRTTSYTYDKLNRQITTTDPLNNTTTTTYDADGNVSTVTDALHNTTSYTYYVLNRLIATTNALSQTTSLSLDAAGNVLVMTDPAGNKTTYVYDALNRQLSETQTGAGGYADDYLRCDRERDLPYRWGWEDAAIYLRFAQLRDLGAVA